LPKAFALQLSSILGKPLLNYFSTPLSRPSPLTRSSLIKLRTYPTFTAAK
jgi:hypothetical protein